MVRTLEGKNNHPFDEMIMEIVTGPISGASPPEELAYLQRYAVGLREKWRKAPQEEKPQLRHKLAVALRKQLEVTPYQRPSNDYQELYKRVILEIESIRVEAESEK